MDVFLNIVIIGGIAALIGYRIWAKNFQGGPEARAQRREEAAERKRQAFLAPHKARQQGKSEVEARAAAQIAQGDKKIDAPISQVGKRDDGTLACLRCSGTQFKAKRSGAAKGVAATGVFVAGPIGLAALANASQVQCVTCGTVYGRG